MDERATFEAISHVIEFVGVGAIVLGIALSGARFGSRVARREPEAYAQLRSSIGRTLLLGLELLVAADIVATVAVDPTFASLGALAILVGVRTFLSWALSVEIEGRWPWQARAAREGSPEGRAAAVREVESLGGPTSSPSPG